MTYTPDPWLILKLKSELSVEEIDKLATDEAWKAIRDAQNFQNRRDDATKPTLTICFAGFTPEIKEKYGDRAFEIGFEVINNVTKRLDFLVCGPTIGPSKIVSSEKLGVEILTQSEFKTLYKTGRFPKRF